MEETKLRKQVSDLKAKNEILCLQLRDSHEKEQQLSSLVKSLTDTLSQLDFKFPLRDINLTLNGEFTATRVKDLERERDNCSHSVDRRVRDIIMNLTQCQNCQHLNKQLEQLKSQLQLANNTIIQNQHWKLQYQCSQRSNIKLNDKLMQTQQQLQSKKMKQQKLQSKQNRSYRQQIQNINSQYFNSPQAYKNHFSPSHANQINVNSTKQNKFESYRKHRFENYKQNYEEYYKYDKNDIDVSLQGEKQNKMVKQITNIVEQLSSQKKILSDKNKSDFQPLLFSIKNGINRHKSSLFQ